MLTLWTMKPFFHYMQTSLELWFSILYFKRKINCKHKWFMNTVWWFICKERLQLFMHMKHFKMSATVIHWDAHCCCRGHTSKEEERPSFSKVDIFDFTITLGTKCTKNVIQIYAIDWTIHEIQKFWLIPELLSTSKDTEIFCFLII